MIRSGDEYRASIRDGREVWMNGERIRDVTAHPAFKPLVDARARIYDMAHDTDTRDVMSYEDAATGERHAIGLKLPKVREDWVAKLRKADIVSAPINTMLEASNDPDVLANGYVTEVDYPKHGKRLKVHGTPWQFSETPARPGIAPELGNHNDAALAELGYSPAEVADLRARKII